MSAGHTKKSVMEFECALDSFSGTETAAFVQAAPLAVQKT
jgi:hypothetical protein